MLLKSFGFCSYKLYIFYNNIYGFSYLFIVHVTYYSDLSKLNVHLLQKIRRYFLKKHRNIFYFYAILFLVNTINGSLTNV